RDHDSGNVAATQDYIEVQSWSVILGRHRGRNLWICIVDRRERLKVMEVADEILAPIAAPNDCDFRHLRSPRIESECDADPAPRRMPPEEPEAPRTRLKCSISALPRACNHCDSEG